ncbi:hypothetical protein [Roseovarius sp. SYSU LYC5161]|uniref:hypothetical protein n=1 Tax=Roseovarius halophilus (ex Wu et al. 2025) TaxID=3376060 RepID=UPI00399ACF7B
MKNILSASLTAALSLGAGGAAVAGSGNNAFVIQETPPNVSDGNSLSIDQSGASNSSVAGVSRNSVDPNDATNIISLAPAPDETQFLSIEDPLISFDPNGAATQSGIGNSASIVAGSDTQVGMFQSGDYNDGSIDAGSGQVLLYQEGNNNSGTLSTAGGASRASLLQEGNNNVGTVAVVGTDAEGLLTQVGDGNNTSLDVTTAGASVSFTVEGNNTSTSLPASVVSTSGGGQVTIIQRPLGSQ